MSKIRKRLRDMGPRHGTIVAYLALGLAAAALGGTGYAAVGSPTAQVARSRTVSQRRLETGAVVRYWAVVTGSGRVLQSGPVRPRRAGRGGNRLQIDFGRSRPGNCFVLGNVEGHSDAGSVSANFELFDNRYVIANTFTSTAGVAAPVAVAVLCSP